MSGASLLIFQDQSIGPILFVVKQPQRQLLAREFSCFRFQTQNITVASSDQSPRSGGMLGSGQEVFNKIKHFVVAGGPCTISRGRRAGFVRLSEIQSSPGPLEIVRSFR
jgi:hypothetical protein